MVKYDYVKTRREDVKPFKEEQLPAIKKVLRWVTKIQVAIYRASKGRLATKFLGGYPVCVVTTKGAKSGKTRRIALIHLPYENDILLVASSGGMPTNPVWYHNIRAHSNIEIMVAGSERTYHARQIDDDEKAALWPHLVSLFPDFDEYQARTDRNIPVFRCALVNP